MAGRYRRGAVAGAGSGHRHEAQAELVIRCLAQFGALPGGPGDGLLVQRQIDHVVARDGHRFGDQGTALASVEFGRIFGNRASSAGFE